MKGLRGERLGSEFQKEVTSVISTKLRNKYPEMSAIISVTQADVAPDLKSAKIYLSIFDINEQKRENTLAIIKDNAGFIRHELAQVMHIRTVPELRFILDGSSEYGSHIDSILNQLEKESKHND